MWQQHPPTVTSSSQVNELTNCATTRPPLLSSTPFTHNLMMITCDRISGCCDWEHMTAKTAAGLDGLHRVPLPPSSSSSSAPPSVQETFSSPSSCHVFILLADQRLFVMVRRHISHHNRMLRWSQPASLCCTVLYCAILHCTVL